MSNQYLQIIKVNELWIEPLSTFFQWLNNSGETDFFAPHPFTKEMAQHIVRYKGKDLYYILVDESNILGYGMLRGWDEGYEIPSLGLFIHPNFRRVGLGKLLVLFLHLTAKHRGALKIRLTVNQDNLAAIQLYKKVGYDFREEFQGKKIGFFNL